MCFAIEETALDTGWDALSDRAIMPDKATASEASPLSDIVSSRACSDTSAQAIEVRACLQMHIAAMEEDKLLS